MSEILPVEYRLESSAFPDIALSVSRVYVHEAITSPYAADVAIAIQDVDASTELLMGSDAVLVLARGTVERRFCGIVADVQETRVENGEPAARLRIVPALELARHRRNTRMFQEKTVPEILEIVLGETLSSHGREAPQLDLEGTYEPREYCLQYRESDFDFVQRLMEEEGIAYVFDHSGEVEKLRLTDRNAAFEPIASLGGEIAQFAPHNALVLTDVEPVLRFDVVAQERTTAVVVRDFDWTLSDYVVTETAAGEDSEGRTRESYEHGRGRSLSIGSYDEGVRRYQKNDAVAQSKLRQEAGLAFLRAGNGVGLVIGMQPGYRFSLTGHPSPGVDGDWLVTQVEHQSVPAESGSGQSERYHNRFVCIPLATPYRPPRTVPAPRIHGVEPAIVTGPSGEEIHVDEHGRIKVQFYWDRDNPADETSSCWIRVKQEWAGPGWGFYWVPRMGMEVVVHFVDGDPDRPLVTGCVYDATNPTPYALPDEKTKSTIKSASSLGGNGFNELRFEDKASSEEIFTHAQKDYNEVVENDHDTLVHHDQSNTVDNDQTQTIDVNQKERVDVNQTMTVGANRTVHVKGTFDEKVDGTETRNVSGAVTESFGASETRLIASNVTESIGAGETRDVSADLTEIIGASHTQMVGGSSTLDISGSLTRTAAGGIKTMTPAAQNITIAGSWTITAAAGITLTAPAGINMIMAGGMKRADSFWHGLFGQKIDTKGFEQEGFVTKMDISGVASGLWVVLKMDIGSSNREVNLAHMIMEGAKINKDVYADITDAALGTFQAVRLAL